MKQRDICGLPRDAAARLVRESGWTLRLIARLYRRGQRAAAQRIARFVVGRGCAEALS